jgi:hypothetical protein
MQIIKTVMSFVLAASMLMSPVQASAAGNGSNSSTQTVKHVLLISVDGLHALDLAKYVKSHENSTLAKLSRSGIT